MVRNQRDEVGDIQQAYAYTNFTSDPSVDCNSNSALVNGDAIGTVVKELIALGILNGTVSA